MILQLLNSSEFEASAFPSVEFTILLAPSHLAYAQRALLYED